MKKSPKPKKKSEPIRSMDNPVYMHPDWAATKKKGEKRKTSGLIQACLFRRNTESKREVGLAFLNSGFGVCDVEFIVDRKGNKVKDVWNYDLVTWLPMGAGIDLNKVRF